MRTMHRIFNLMRDGEAKTIDVKKYYIYALRALDESNGMNQKRDHDAGSSLDPTGAAPSFRAEEKQAKARQVSSRMRWLLGTDWKQRLDRKSTRLNSSHVKISYAVFCL